MSPHALLATALTLACLVGAGGAHAADRVIASRTEAACAPAETVSTEFSEQVCYRGVGGYEACRWLPRTHVVDIPATCDVLSVRGVTPAYRPLVRK